MNGLQAPGMYTPQPQIGTFPNTTDTNQPPMTGGCIPYPTYPPNSYLPAMPMATNQDMYTQPMPVGPAPYATENINNYPSSMMPNPVIYGSNPYGPPQDMYMPANYTPIPIAPPPVMMPANYTPVGLTQAPSGFAPMNMSGPPPQQLGPNQNHWVA